MMKYSTKLSDAMHILTLIALNPYDKLSSDSIAESLHTNAGFVRQIMSILRNGGIITTIAGHPKPHLTRSPKEITLFDVYKLIEKDKPLPHLNANTNPECGVDINIQYALQEYYDDV